MLRLAAIPLTVAALVAATGAAQAAPPVSGATYSGGSAQAAQVALTVSDDGARVYGLYGRDIAVTCTVAGQVERKQVDFNDEVTPQVDYPIRPDGSFEAAVGTDDDATVRGTFAADGTVSGTVAFARPDGCRATLPFTSTAQPRQAGTSRRVFTLAGGYGAFRSSRTASTAALFAESAFSLSRGSIGLMDNKDPEGASDGSLRRIDRFGRISTFQKIGRTPEQAPADAARVAGGSIVYTLPGQDCLRRRTPSGRVRTVLGRCRGRSRGVNDPVRVAAAPGGGFVFSDSVRGGDRVRRVSRGGRVSAVATVKDLTGLAVQRDSSVLLGQANRVVRVSRSGRSTTVAGNGQNRFGGDGGPATAAGLAPGEIATLPGGGFLVVDQTVNRIRQVSAGGRITTFAGGGQLGDGAAAGRAVIRPTTLDVLGDGSVVFAQAERLRIIPPARTARLLVGLPDLPGDYAERARAGRGLNVSLTRAARVRVILSRGGRVLSSTSARVRAGTSEVRAPRLAAGRGAVRLRVRATAGRRVAADGLTLP